MAFATAVVTQYRAFDPANDTFGVDSASAIVEMLSQISFIPAAWLRAANNGGDTWAPSNH